MRCTAATTMTWPGAWYATGRQQAQLANTCKNSLESKIYAIKINQPITTVMTNNSRPDIIESKILDSKFHLNSISFNEIQRIFYDFMKDVFLPKISLEEKISNEIKTILKSNNEAIKLFLEGNINETEINKIGIASLHDAEKTAGLEKDVILFSNKGLTDKKRAFFEEYEASMHIQSLFFSLYKMGYGEFCIMFRKYIEKHPIMKNYST
jgi:hypothetical protein